MQTVFWKNGGKIDIIEENYVSTTLVNHLENAADETNESLERCMQSLDSLHEKVENLVNNTRMQLKIALTTQTTATLEFNHLETPAMVNQQTKIGSRHKTMLLFTIFKNRV